jgi:hypothetical protein
MPAEATVMVEVVIRGTPEDIRLLGAAIRAAFAVFNGNESPLASAENEAICHALAPLTAVDADLKEAD